MQNFVIHVCLFFQGDSVLGMITNVITLSISVCDCVCFSNLYVFLDEPPDTDEEDIITEAEENEGAQICYV